MHLKVLSDIYIMNYQLILCGIMLVFSLQVCESALMKEVRCNIVDSGDFIYGR